MSKFDLAGRKALVTGGARGLGAGMAAALSKAGAAVMIGDVLTDVGRETAKAIAAGGAKAAFVTLDVTDDASWQAAVSTTIAQLGGFDILVNNAGIEITSLVINVEAKDLRRMWDVNVVGAALGMKHAFRAMKPDGAAGKGGAARQHRLGGGDHRVSGDRRLFRDQVGRRPADPGRRDGIGQARLWRPRQCIYPGLVATDMGVQLAGDVVAAGLAPSVEAAIGGVIGQTPLARLGEVADMADAVVFLASDAARFITGAGLPVDGGMGM